MEMEAIGLCHTHTHAHSTAAMIPACVWCMLAQTVDLRFKGEPPEGALRPFEYQYGLSDQSTVMTCLACLSVRPGGPILRADSACAPMVGGAGTERGNREFLC